MNPISTFGGRIVSVPRLTESEKTAMGCRKAVVAAPRKVGYYLRGSSFLFFERIFGFAQSHLPKFLLLFTTVALSLLSKGQVTITAPSLTAYSCNGSYPSIYYNLGNIVISETLNGDFSGNGTLVITAPTNFEFNPNIGTVTVAAQSPINISVTATSITSSTITITFSVLQNNKLDVVTISGVQVRGINAATGPSNLTITGGTATINGANVGTILATLSSQNVSLPTLPVATSNSRCGTGTVTIGATPGSGETIDWYGASSGGTALSTGTTSYTTSPISATTIYYAEARNTTIGCVSAMRTAVTATVNLNPTANEGGAVAAICQGGTSVQMGGSVGGGATGGIWSGGAGTWTNASNPSTATYTASASESGNITLTLTTSGGSCGTTTATKTITVNQNPTANAGGAVAAICQGGTSVQMGGSAGGGATVATWSGGSGTWTNANNPSAAAYTASATESGNIILTLTTSSGSCGTTTATKTITVNPNPTANAGGTVPAICQGGTSAALGGSVGGGATGATWSTTAGGTFSPSSTDLNASWTPPPAYSGTAILVLTTSGGSCGTTNSSKTIVVNPNPTVNVGGAMTAICQGGTSAALGGSFGGGATSAIWSDGGAGGTFANNTGTTPNTATYTAAANSGTPVTLTLTTSGGSCGTTSSSKTIVVNPNPTVNVGGAMTAICQGGTSANLGGSVGGGATGGSWSTTVGGTFSPSSTDLNASWTPPPAYSGTATLVLTTSGGSCGTTGSSKTIVVNPIPVLTQPANQTVCNGSITTATTFTSSVTGSTFAWTNSNPAIGLAASGTGAVPVFTAVNTGNTDLVASITVTPTANGCTGTPKTYTITIYPTPVATLATPATQTICSGTPITKIVFTGTVAGTTYNWNRDNPLGISGSGSLASASGTGDVTGGFTNSLSSQVSVNISVTPTYNGCVGATVNNIAVVKTNPSPTVTTSTATQTVCSGTSTSPLTFSGNGTSYNWTNNNTSIGLAGTGTGNILAFTATNIGTTPATATITVTPVFTADGVSCNGATQSATYVVNPIPVLTSGAPSSSYVCSGSVFNYPPTTGVTVNGVSTFAWTRNVVAGITNPAGSGNGSIAETLVNSTGAAVNVTYNYTLSATHNGVTCTNPTNFPVVISVRPTPTVAIAPSTLPDICSGGIMASAITISNPNNLAGTTFAWSRTNTSNVTGALASDNGNTIAASTLVNTTSTTQSTIFTATATLNSCTSTAIVSQVVYAPISNNTTLPAAIESDICGISKQVEIRPGPAGGGNGTYTYQWQISLTGASDFVDIPGETGESLVYKISVATAFFRRVVTSGTCSSISEKLQVNKPISGGGGLYITTASSSYCAGGSGVTIDLNTTVVGATYKLQYNTTGSTWVDVSGQPVLTGTGGTMSFTNVLTAGKYRVEGNISGTGGCTQVLQNIITVSVDPLPNAPSINSNSPICAGGSASLVASASPSSNNVNWYIDNSTQTPINASPLGSGTIFSQNPTTTTTYWAASVSNAGCISATRTPATVTVNPLPQMTSPNSALICTGGSVSIPLTNDIAGTPSYTWSAIDNPNVTGESTIVQTTSALSNTLSLIPGAVVFQNVVYSVSATVNGCQGPIQTVTVRVDPRPQISSYIVAAICSGNAFSTTPNPAGNTIPINPIATYTWAAPAGMPPTTGGSAQSTPQTSISQTLSNPTSSPANAVYTVTPTAGACVGNTFTVTVPVNPVPSIPTLQNTIACSGTAFNFNPQDGVGGNIIPSGTIYSWAIPTGSFLTGLSAGSNQTSVNGNLINTSNPQAVQTALYQVTAAAGSCSGTFNLNVSVNPTLKGSISGTYLKCQASPAVVQVTITGTGNYSGQLSDGTTFAGTAATSPTIVNVPLAPATVGTVTISQLTNTSTGCVSLAADRTGSATVTALIGTPGLWTGALSSDWFNCANWANGAVPDNSIDVQVAAGAANPLIIDPNSINAPVDKIARAKNIDINKSLSISGFGTLYVAGNWQNNLGVSGFNAGVGEVRFMSSSAKQTINSSDAIENFYKLTIANTSNQANSDEVTLLKAVNVSGVFTLLKGRLLTSSLTPLKITNEVPSAVIANSAGNDTYVNGPMSWTTSGVGAGSEYLFPLGKPTGKYGAYRPVVVIPILPSGPAVSQPTTYSSEYFGSAGPNIGSRVFLGILKTEHWEISRPLGNLDAVVKLFYIKPTDPNDWLDKEPCSTCNVAIAKEYSGTTWYFTNYTNTSSGFNTTLPETRWAGDATGVLYSKLITNFSPFTFGYDYPIVLGSQSTPVTMVSFNAVLQGTDALLTWNINGVSELHSFDVEHSKDGTNFTKLATINKSILSSYNYTDKSIEPGKHYYRIRILDRQGRITYSDIRLLVSTAQPTIIKDLPVTAAKNKLMVDIETSIAQPASFKIFTSTGVLVSARAENIGRGASRTNIDLPFLAPGMYFVQVEVQDGTHRSLKFIKE